MRKFIVSVLIVLAAAIYLVQSKGPLPAVGPAAEAMNMTGEIEITLDEPESVAATASNLK